MTLRKTVVFGSRNEPLAAGTVYAATLALAAASLAAALVASGYGVGDPWTIGALCVIAAVSERGVVRLTSTTSQSISVLPTLFAAVLFGPLAAMLVGAASLISEFGQTPHLKWVTYTSRR